MDHDQFQNMLDKLTKSLSGAPELIKFVQAHSPKGEFAKRVPCGLISKEIRANDYGEIPFTPYMNCIPKYFILSEETAESFNIEDVVIGCAYQKIESESVPLQTFSIKYYANAKNPELLLSLQQWDFDTLRVGSTMKIRIRNTSNDPKVFRGIMWVHSFEYY